MQFFFPKKFVVVFVEKLYGVSGEWFAKLEICI